LTIRKSGMWFWLGRRYGVKSEILLIALADGLHEWIELALLLLPVAWQKQDNLSLRPTVKRTNFLLYSNTCRLALRTSQPPINGKRRPFPRIMWTSCSESDHTHTSRSEVNHAHRHMIFLSCLYDMMLN
jgi:hypothetical protein